MTMMHLRYPSRKGYFSWDELSCMARSLGFPGNIFISHIPEELTKDDSVPIKSFVHMLHEQKYFNQALDLSFNLHTDEWNLSVTSRAAHLLNHHIISFEELHAIRLAFQVYESTSSKGLPISTTKIQRALKMCGRVISPLKMMHRIKHMRGSFETEDHIQLHEFLDLLLWCEAYEEVDMHVFAMTTDKEDNELYTIDNFEEFLNHHDARLAMKLNQVYMSQEWKFSKEKHGSKQMPRDVPPVDPEIRRKQVLFHRKRYKPLEGEVTESQARVYQAQAGYVRQRPVSAPDFADYYQKVHLSTHGNSVVTVNKPLTVLEVAGHLIRPVTADGSLTRESCDTICRPTIPELPRQHTPVAVPSKDVEVTDKEMEDLMFQMETIEMKYKQSLNESLDQMIPGYRDRAAMTVREPPPAPPKVPPPPDPRPSSSTLKRLANPKKIGLPLPTHGKSCDARFRGWHKVRTKPGNHNVLIAPAYDHNLQGQMLQRLANNACSSSQHRRQFIHRHTKHQQVSPDQPRPQTSPANMQRMLSHTRKHKLSTSTSTSRRPPVKVPNRKDSAEGHTDMNEINRNTGEDGQLNKLRQDENSTVFEQQYGKNSTGGKTIGTAPVLEQIHESNQEDEDGEDDSSQPISDGNHDNPAPAAVDVELNDPTKFTFLSPSKSTEWINDILAAPPPAQPTCQSNGRAFKRLSRRARNFGSAQLERRLVMSH